MMIRADKRLIEIINEITGGSLSWEQLKKAYEIRMKERGTPTTKERQKAIIDLMMEKQDLSVLLKKPKKQKAAD